MIARSNRVYTLVMTMATFSSVYTLVMMMATGNTVFTLYSIKISIIRIYIQFAIQIKESTFTLQYAECKYQRDSTARCDVRRAVLPPRASGDNHNEAEII